MAARTSRAKSRSQSQPAVERPADGWIYCDVRPQSRPELPSDLNPERASLIVLNRAKWVNGTVLHYYLFKTSRTEETGVPVRGGARKLNSFAGAEDQLDAVRDAFVSWKDVGMGLEFKEVDQISEAEVRVGFLQGDGSWSYVGRDVLGIAQDERTMNFGWDLTTGWGRITALHEIGHTLGFPHEHQNPNAGIQWDEPAVIAEFSDPPNSWPLQQIQHNILRKLNSNEVEGSDWDPASVMEYPFDPGLILRPVKYRDEGVPAPTGISAKDRTWVTTWYPAVGPKDPPRLTPFQSRNLSLQPGDQADFLVFPEATREYRVGSFGASDVVLVLFEEVNGEPRFLTGDDDSGEDRNALVTAKLHAGRRYIVRLRLYGSWMSGETAVMLW